MMKKKSRKGFTLVEILIVIIILGVLATSLLLSSGGAVPTSKANNIIANMTFVKDAVLAYYMANIDSNPTINGFCEKAKKYLGDTATDDDTTNHKVLELGDVVFYVVNYESDENKWYVRADFSDEPDKTTIKPKLVERRETAQLFNNDNPTQIYSGNDDSVLMRIR